MGMRTILIFEVFLDCLGWIRWLNSLGLGGGMAATAVEVARKARKVLIFILGLGRWWEGQLLRLIVLGAGLYPEGR